MEKFYSQKGKMKRFKRILYKMMYKWMDEIFCQNTPNRVEDEDEDEDGDEDEDEGSRIS